MTPSRLCLCLLFALSAAPASPQATSTSSISGLVTDPRGAAMPAAAVRLTDAATHETHSVRTNQAGRYIFVNLPPGSYQLTFSREGFSIYQIDDQTVAVGASVTVNATLQVGSVSTTVEVKAAIGAELVRTNAAVGSTIGANELASLPNFVREASTLATLQPGTTATGFVAGVFKDQNTFQIDGGNASSDMDGTQTYYTTTFAAAATPSAVVPVPVESIEEFRVTSFNQTADFNGSAGSQAQMVTKRGTSQWHGSAYEYYFGTNIGAANLWANNHKLLNGAATPLPPNHRNRFGGTVGGPLIPRDILGGKTYVFVNYEGYRFPNVSSYEHIVPSDLLRLGVIQVPNSAGVWQPYNINPYPVTYQGVTYSPAACPSGLCDPRGVGLNPVVGQIWSKFMPEPNDLANFGDHYNTQGLLSSLRAPQSSNSYIARLDHDFNSNWRLMASYRYTRYVELNPAQIDLGGAFPGDTKGTPTATSPRDQLPGYFVTGLTTNLTPTATNSLRFNYTRNFWQYGSFGAPPQLPGMGAALEIGGESCTNNLTPYCTNATSARRRYWDGIGTNLADDITLLKRNHLLQFGGAWQRTVDTFQRDDNGGASFTDPTYVSTSSGLSFPTAYIPAAIPASQVSSFTGLYAELLGIVNQSQVVYTRAGTNLQLQPQGTPAQNHSIVPSYSAYFSDTWQIKPTVILTYGLGYLLTMPPYEVHGNQVILTDPSGKPIAAESYLAQRQSAALAGQGYQPQIAFDMVRNASGLGKYPFDPFYAGFSPRVSAAWNPKFGHGATVVRAGYGRIYGRLNGVDLVLTPMLGPGPIQAVSCVAPGMTGQCLGNGNADATNAFRIGTDGLVAPLPSVSQTLPQPYIPNVNGNPAAADAALLDRRYRPDRTDNFTVSVQHEFSTAMSFELGYLGRLLRNEFDEVNLDAVPYMTTLGGQSFAQAWAAIYNALYPNGLSSGLAPAALPAQPFLEAALGGANSSYCAGFPSCTAAAVSKNSTLIQYTRVSDFWKALNAAPSWTLGRTMISGIPAQASSVGLYGPFGHGNYNAAFLTFRLRDWHSLTAISNFTYGRALGTASIAQVTSGNILLDPWNPHDSYGPQSFDLKFIYNLALYYQPRFHNRLLRGWMLAPLFTAQSGSPIGVNYSESGCTACQAFGEATSPANLISDAEYAVGAATYTGTPSAKYNVAGSAGVGTSNPTGINMFSNPAAILAQFRPCVLGFDSSCGGIGNLRGLPTWNLDASISKDIAFAERFGANLSFQFTNLLNHMQPANPSLSLTSPQAFGVISGQANSPRSMEFGLRLHF